MTTQEMEALQMGDKVKHATQGNCIAGNADTGHTHHTLDVLGQPKRCVWLRKVTYRNGNLQLDNFLEYHPHKIERL